MKQRNPILEKSVNKTLIAMSTPISLGMLSTFLFQLIDTYFVGKLGSPELAAISFSSTIFFLVLSIFMGLSIGTSSIVAKAKGENNKEKIKHNTTTAILLTFIIAIIIAITGYVTIEPLFIILGASKEVLPLIKIYMGITFLTMPLLTIGLVGSGALRSTGHIKYPEIIFGIAGIINLLFDYLLIFGKGPFPELGLQGAAIATALSWLFLTVGMLYKLQKEKLLTLQIKKIKRKTKNIITLSTPAIGAQLLSPITITFVIFLLAKVGQEAVAGYGIASRIQSLLMIGIYAVGIALTPFIAQNHGAKKKLRVDEAIRFAGKASTYLGILIFLILLTLATPIATIFTNDPVIINVVKTYFYIIAISYASLGLINVTTSIFNGIQQPKKALKIILVKSIVLTLPLVIIGSYFGLKGILIGIALSNILAAMYAAKIMKQHIKKTKSSLKNINILQDYKQDIKKLFRKT